MLNSERQIVKIIKEICLENNIKLQTYSYDWIMQLIIGDKNVFIFGYQFQNNNSVADRICEDKSALSGILIKHGIAAVEHKLFMTPKENMKYTGADGNWKSIVGLLNAHGSLVCKKNDGTGGNDVYKVTGQLQLEDAVFNIFKSSRTMAVSPYYEIEDEYRVIILNGEAELIYRKERPYVTGDGVKTLRQLYTEKYEFQEIISDDSDNDINMQEIIPDGGKKYLSWKHNLGKGATAEIVYDSDIGNSLADLALSASRTINISFASVDIIKTEGEYKILEINSGIMMENFARINDEYYRIAKNIYKKAIGQLPV